MDKEYKDEIIAARPTNIGRILISFVIFFIAYLYDLLGLKYTALFHISIGIAWFYFVEKHFKFYVNYPRFWYFNSFIDLFTVTIFVYLTGVSHSFIIVGYIIVTTLSSIDLNPKRGKFAAYLGSFFYTNLSIIQYFQLIPYMNVLTKNTEEVTLLAIILSTLMLLIGNIVTNLVVFGIYNKLNETNNILNNKFEEIKQLKFQQDGDYYLTSLLIEPLWENNLNSENIKIEYYINQYKKFMFRNVQKEIGGDVVLCDSITLNNQKYIVFINGDAMGKSIQGAGGALVLGVVLKSVLTRTKEEISVREPGVWLLNTYNELQKIFESFDGLMLISAVLGLINEASGKLYYMNMEHPAMVIYRGGKADYIELEEHVPKIGTPYIKKPDKVFTYQLFSGDNLFIGSDGKDDLVLKNEDLKDKYNSDETLFLKIIENHRGELDEIIKYLPSYGSVIDDLSLLKISFV